MLLFFMEMPAQELRIVDANLNRASEGLRFLENVARFTIGDSPLCQQFKNMRHDLAEETKSLGINLLSHRDAGHDVGTSIKSAAHKQSRRDLSSLITANAKRAEESLRTIEELAKLPQLSPILKSPKFEQLRFTLYALEQQLTSRILRQDKMNRLSGLYVILDRQILAGRNELEIARQVIQSGVKVIQLRDKQSSKAELLPIAQKVKDLCAKSNVLLIINDYLDLALAIDADGLHIGQRELPLPIMRRKLPIDKIIGCSVNTISQATKAQDEGADYISVGSIFPTGTKENAIVVGIDRFKQIRQVVPSPLVAIGGINENNISQVMAAGANSVAVISAILAKEDIKGAAKKLMAKMEVG